MSVSKLSRSFFICSACIGAFVAQLNVSGATSVAMRFVPLRSPCRFADTRQTAGPFGGPMIVGGTTRDFLIPSSACIVPASALAYSLNVTVVPGGQRLGYLTVYPTG